MQAHLAELTKLHQVLPKLLQNLSISRAQIAMDQLSGIVDAHGLRRIVLVFAGSEKSPETPLAAGIAIQLVHGRTDQDVDMASIVHLGAVEEGLTEQSEQEAIRAISSLMDQSLRDRGVDFVQWATDPRDELDRSVLNWCHGCGFHAIGQLDYLHARVEDAGDPSQTEDSQPAESTRQVSFEHVSAPPDAFDDEFATLVEQTYTQTLDCPQLAEYRTASQTLAGYQASGAFDPSLWFRVEQDQQAIGCLILARHESAALTEGKQSTAVVIEIVYMGLIPAARGKGLGKRLVERAIRAARELGAEQIILAVDRQNQPAGEIYRSAGLQPMLHETVWVKSLTE